MDLYPPSGHVTSESEESEESEEPLLSQYLADSDSAAKMFNQLPTDASPVFIAGLRIINLLIFLTSIALLIYSTIYVRKPGPTSYYSHFSSLYLSTCLAFQTLQIFRVTRKQRSESQSLRYGFLYTYLVVVMLSGLIDGIAFAFTPKPDTTAIAFLAFIDGSTGILHKILAAKISHSNKSIQDSVLEEQNVVAARKNSTTELVPGILAGTKIHANAELSETANFSKKRTWQYRKYSFRFLKVGNRILMVIHSLLVLISIAGAIELALLYRYSNPGTIVAVKLASGLVSKINYNCTSVPSTNLSQPTIWLESDNAHGVVDFLGLQTALAQDYGRNSCSYDPPSFGWSDRLPSDLENFYGYFNPLLKATGRETEDMVLVGWGGGAENALMHAIENSNTTTALVIMDASPDGIEWMAVANQNNWTEAQMLQYRSTDLQSRIFLTETILGLGIPWGLMPIFIPSNSSGYYETSLYSRYRAQGMKEDLWAGQYYELVQEAATTIDPYLVTTVAPEGMKVYSIMTYDAGSPPTNTASNDFYRETKLSMVNHIAGGNLSAPVVWCNASDCSLSFPVNKPGWTAAALMSLGV